MFNYTTVGKRIRQYRLAIGKTQEELAEKAGISANYLSNLETGQAAGRLAKYYSVAQALGVTIDMLVDSTSERVSSDDRLFSNQILPVILELSANQRKMLTDFISLLTKYNIDISETKRG